MDQTARNVVGALGGAVLSACLLPQLYRLWRTRSARDLSYLYLIAYSTGLLLTFIYLYFEGATVAWICMLIEIGVHRSPGGYSDHRRRLPSTRLEPSGSEHQTQAEEGERGTRSLRPLCDSSTRLWEWGHPSWLVGHGMAEPEPSSRALS